LKQNVETMDDEFKSLNSPTFELQQASSNQWKKTRVDRMIVEHFLRYGYYESAEKLASRSDIRDLTNLDIFQVSREVERDLANHCTIKAISWCNDNKSKLKKINSNIEFQLRVQEFVELIRQNSRVDAVKHAQRYFPLFEQEQLKDISQYMALLAYPTNTGDISCIDLFVFFKSIFNSSRT
jgi:macrophage erythroblast attacher